MHHILLLWLTNDVHTRTIRRIWILALLVVIGSTGSHSGSELLLLIRRLLIHLLLVLLHIRGLRLLLLLLL